MDARTMASTLRAICRNDATRYDHHARRAWDGKPPETDGGTIWRSPREIAYAALRRLHREGLISEAETLWDLSEDEVARRVAVAVAAETAVPA